MAKLKVFGGLVFAGRKCQVRTIVAATSQAKAAELLHVSVGQLRTWWSETGNATELQVALSKPGQVFQASSTMTKDFRPVTWVAGAWA